MKIEVFTLCDYAKAETSGKLYVIGTFDRLFAKEPPVPMAASAIAARLRFDEFEQGTRPAVLSFVDSDGVKVIPDIPMQMNIQLPAGESTITANLVIVLPPLRLSRFGEYSIDLTVGGRLEGSLPLYVRPMPAGAGGPAAFA